MMTLFPTISPFSCLSLSLADSPFRLRTTLEPLCECRGEKFSQETIMPSHLISSAGREEKNSSILVFVQCFPVRYPTAKNKEMENPLPSVFRISNYTDARAKFLCLCRSPLERNKKSKNKIKIADGFCLVFLLCRHESSDVVAKTELVAALFRSSLNSVDLRSLSVSNHLNASQRLAWCAGPCIVPNDVVAHQSTVNRSWEGINKYVPRVKYSTRIEMLHAINESSKTVLGMPRPSHSDRKDPGRMDPVLR